MSRAEDKTLRDVTRKLRERLQEPARQATLLGLLYTLLRKPDLTLPDRDLCDATGAVVKSLQEHGTSHETAACNGCEALAMLSQFALADGSRPFEKAGAEVTLAAMRAFPRNAHLQAAAGSIIANSCGVLSSKELFAAGGAVDAIAAVLLSAGGDVECCHEECWHRAKRTASFALANCCIGRPAVVARAHQRGASSAILAALRANPANAATHCRALRILAQKDPRASLALISEGAVEALAEAMRARPLDAGLQYFGLSTLLDLLFAVKEGDGNRRVSDVGAAVLALTALREEGRMLFDRVAQSLNVTRDMVRMTALFIIRALFATGAAVARAVTEAMIAHSEHEETQREVCLILDEIVHLQQESEAAIAAGAPEAIMRALQRFPELGHDIAWARGAGWHALAEMSGARWRCAMPAVTAGGLEVACDALRRHLARGDEESIIFNVVRSLANLLLDSDSKGGRAAGCTVKRRAVAAGCVELLVSAARKYPENEELVAYMAVVALGNLSFEEPACAGRIIEAGGVEVACAVLRRVRDQHPGRVALCAMAINNVSLSSPAGAVRVREAGALELFAEAVRSFPEDEGVKKQCKEAIRWYEQNDCVIKRWEIGAAAAQPPAATAAPAADGTKAGAPPPASTSAAAAQPAGGGVEQRAPPSPPRVCHNCGAQVGGSNPLGQPVRKLSACGGCRGVRYCSKACNKEAWPSHKAACKKKQAEAAAAKEKVGSAAARARDGQ